MVAKILRLHSLKRLGKVGFALLVLNEIRGVVVVAPIVWAWINRG